jgi:nitroreductase
MIDILRTRRSVRRYEKRPVDPGALAVIEEALLRCPSSRGFDPWTFLLVDDPDVLSRLSLAKEHGSDFLKSAALGIVICGDESRSDVWVEDCAIAAIVAQLTAQSLGLGSCWIQIRKRPHSPKKSAEEYVREILAIPAGLRVASIVSMGYPAESKQPKPRTGLDYGKIYRNQYGAS